jgi:hypothetical protein
MYLKSTERGVKRELTRYFSSPEYWSIQAFYWNKSAARSDVPYINHINEGVKILLNIGADRDAIYGYILHPIFQDQDTDVAVRQLSEGVQASSIQAAIRYKKWANAWLSEKVVSPNNVIGQPSFGGDEVVRQMLIADKVQNKKDFLLYHKHSHPRSRQLEVYFDTWLTVLGISPIEFDRLSAVAVK